MACSVRRLTPINNPDTTGPGAFPPARSKRMDDAENYGLNNAQATAVHQVFEALARKKAALMADEMRDMARTGGERHLLRFADGNGGEVKMQVHPMSYHYWGQRLGYQCWRDGQFVAEYLRDNPEARVKNISQVTTLIVPGHGGLAATGKTRFHKTYTRN